LPELWQPEFGEIDICSQPAAKCHQFGRYLLWAHRAVRYTAVLDRRAMSETLRLRSMEPVDLEPRYSSGELPGKSIKCLAEQKLDGCLRELLRGEDSAEVWQRFQILVTFLKSPESQRLRDEAEKYLAEGKKVRLRLSLTDGKLKCGLNKEG